MKEPPLSGQQAGDTHPTGMLSCPTYNCETQVPHRESTANKVDVARQTRHRSRLSQNIYSEPVCIELSCEVWELKRN